MGECPSKEKKKVIKKRPIDPIAYEPTYDRSLHISRLGEETTEGEEKSRKIIAKKKEENKEAKEKAEQRENAERRGNAERRENEE